MDVQQSKKHLAGVLLSPHDGESVDDSLERLQVYHAFFFFLFQGTNLPIPSDTDYGRLCRNCGHCYRFRRRLGIECYPGVTDKRWGRNAQNNGNFRAAFWASRFRGCHLWLQKVQVLEAPEQAYVNEMEVAQGKI